MSGRELQGEDSKGCTAALERGHLSGGRRRMCWGEGPPREFQGPLPSSTQNTQNTRSNCGKMPTRVKRKWQAKGECSMFYSPCFLLSQEYCITRGSGCFSDGRDGMSEGGSAGGDLRRGQTGKL